MEVMDAARQRASSASSAASPYHQHHAVARGRARVDPFAVLPDELALVILRHCNVSQLNACALVSRRWRELATDRTLWKRLGVARPRFVPQRLWFWHPVHNMRFLLWHEFQREEKVRYERLYERHEIRGEHYQAMVRLFSWMMPLVMAVLESNLVPALASAALIGLSHLLFNPRIYKRVIRRKRPQRQHYQHQQRSDHRYRISGRTNNTTTSTSTPMTTTTTTTSNIDHHDNAGVSTNKPFGLSLHESYHDLDHDFDPDLDLDGDDSVLDHTDSHSVEDIYMFDYTDPNFDPTTARRLAIQRVISVLVYLIAITAAAPVIVRNVSILSTDRPLLQPLVLGLTVLLKASSSLMLFMFPVPSAPRSGHLLHLLFYEAAALLQLFWMLPQQYWLVMAAMTVATLLVPTLIDYVVSYRHRWTSLYQQRLLFGWHLWPVNHHHHEELLDMMHLHAQADVHTPPTLLAAGVPNFVLHAGRAIVLAPIGIVLSMALQLFYATGRLLGLEHIWPSPVSVASATHLWAILLFASFLEVVFYVWSRLLSDVAHRRTASEPSKQQLRSLDNSTFETSDSGASTGAGTTAMMIMAVSWSTILRQIKRTHREHAPFLMTFLIYCALAFLTLYNRFVPAPAATAAVDA